MEDVLQLLIWGPKGEPRKAESSPEGQNVDHLPELMAWAFELLLVSVMDVGQELCT